MANKYVNHPLDPFDNANFDIIAGNINTTTVIKKIEEIIETNRKDIFNILSTGRANGNTGTDETSLKNMKDILGKKRNTLQLKLGKVLADFDISSNDDDLIDLCECILNKPKAGNKKSDLAKRCRNLLEDLQNVYTKGKRREKLFSGKKDPANGTFHNLTDLDYFNKIFKSSDRGELENNINEFIKGVYNPKDNSFSISNKKLYGKNQAEIAARIAIFLHCMRKALSEGRISDTSQVKRILDKLEKDQIPRIRGLYNLQKEEKAVNAEYDTLVDIRNNDTTDLTYTDTTSNIDLTDSFEGKSNDKAKKIDLYSLDKNSINISISGTTHSGSDIILKDLSGETDQINTEIGKKSGDYFLFLRTAGGEVRIGTLNIDYDSTSGKAFFKFSKNPNLLDELRDKGVTVTGNVNIEIPVTAIKNVATDRSHTGQVSLCRKIKLTVTGGVVPPTGPSHTPTLNEQKEQLLTITNVDQVNRAIAECEADEELRERYENVGWNIFDRANLFFRRKFIKDKIVYKKIKGKKGIDWSEAAQSSAHRHQIEKQENLEENLKSLVEIDSDNYPDTRAKLDRLIDDVTGKDSSWTSGISDSNFKIQFEHILKKSGIDFDKNKPASATIGNRKPISKIIKSNHIESLSTNILMQAKQFQAHQRMVHNIHEHILSNPTEGDDEFDIWCRGEIGNYINTYDDIPDFLQQVGLSLDNVDDIKTLKAHDAALTSIQAQSLKYRLQILDGGGEAYSVKKRGGLLTKIGRFFDDPIKDIKWFRRHPHIKEAIGWIRGGSRLATTVLVPWHFLAPFGPIKLAWGVGGLTFLRTLVSKKSHYEKENRSYQRMQARNLTDYREKRTRLADDVAGMKFYERFGLWGEKHRIRKQYKYHVLTTHDQLLSTNELLTNIKNYFNKGTALTIAEKDELGKLLANGLARLDYHKKTGQNFLGSDNPTVAESEYKKLQNAIIGGTLRLRIDTNDLRNNDPYAIYYNDTKDLIEGGTGKQYNTQGYLRAKKKFSRRSNKARRSAFKAGAVSFGLSLLASKLASGEKITTNETPNDVHYGEPGSNYAGGEYNLGDAQEHLFVRGDLDSTMNTVITADTQKITGATIYSSVDSVPCSIAKGAKELGLAQTDLTTTFSASPFAGNTNWIDAQNNFINEARNSIWSISGVSEGNRQLALARAIEGRNEGILKPAIASGNSSIGIDPSGIHRFDGGIQASTEAAGQVYRNMGIVSLDCLKKGADIVEPVTRAIPIPVRLNEFGEPKSEVKKRAA